MAILDDRLYLGQPGTVIGTLYTVPASSRVIVKNITICNTTGVAATLTLHLVPNAGAAGVANMIFNALSIPANDSRIFDFTVLAMDTVGDTLQALQGTAAALTVAISGVVIT